MIAAIKDLVAAAPIPIVFDHFGGARAELGSRQPGFAELVDLVRSGRAYVKISGAYRASTLAPDYADVVPLARALIAANPERIVWGTDWPHPDAATRPGGKPTDVNPPLPIDDARLLSQLPVGARGGGPPADPGRQPGGTLRLLAGRTRPTAPARGVESRGAFSGTGR